MNLAPVASGSVPAVETRTLICGECSDAFTLDLPAIPALRNVALRNLPSRCTTCAMKVEACAAREQTTRNREQRRQKRVELWTAICPPCYADTDPTRLPEAAHLAVEAWQIGPRGLAFVGSSGRGKTRAMMLLGRRLVLDEARSFAYVPASEFAHKVSRLASERMADLDAYLHRLCALEVLFLDDLGKDRITDRVEAELYHVIEQRTAHHRPILFTANASAAGLAAMLSPDRGQPIIRRLREYIEIVVL